MKYKSLLILFISFLLNANFAYSVDIVKSDSIKTQISPLSPIVELQRDIQSLIDNPDYFNSIIGISIVSIDNGETIFKKNDTKNFIPASTAKIMTSAAALEYLGKDFRFTSSVYLDGKIESNGEFTGNIIIRGSGDPSMSKAFMENPSEILDKWAAALDSIGIKSIRGNIIGDDNYFDDVYYGPGWSWDDMIYPFSAQVNSLSIYDNKIDIIIESPDSINQSPHITCIPDNNYTSIINSIRTGSESDMTDINPFKDDNTNIIELEGVIKYNKQKKEKSVISVSVTNPTLFFLNLFKSAIERKNIKFRGALIDIDDWNQKFSYSNAQAICSHSSPPLSEIIKELNKNSNNLVAEMLFKTIAKENTGKGSFQKAAEQISKFCVKIGISPENMSIADGSGLSRYNLISPRYQTALLSFIHRASYKTEFINSLACPGETGTLKNRMIRTKAENNLWAKTGSMNAVSTLAGYVQTKDSELLAFSIMIMNHTVALNVVHNLQDLICMRLAGFSRKKK